MTTQKHAKELLAKANQAACDSETFKEAQATFHKEQSFDLARKYAKMAETEMATAADFLALINPDCLLPDDRIEFNFLKGKVRVQ